jgi:hypothetical protein
MCTLGIFLWKAAEVFVSNTVKFAHDWRAINTDSSSLDEVGFVNNLTRLQPIFQMTLQVPGDPGFRGHVVSSHELEDARVAVPLVSKVNPWNFSTTSSGEKKT